MSSVVLVVQLPSRVQLYNPKDCSTPGLPVPHHFPKFAQVHVHYIGDAIQPSHPLMPSFLLPSIIPSIRDFSNELSVCIRWPKYWSFSFSISPSNEYSGLLSFKFDRFDLPAVQGTPRSLLQHHSLKATNSLALCLLYGSAPTTVSDQREDHSLDYTDLCQQCLWLTSLVAQTVKHLSTKWETRVQSLGWDDPLEKEMAIHSSTLAWKIP